MTNTFSDPIADGSIGPDPLSTGELGPDPLAGKVAPIPVPEFDFSSPQVGQGVTRMRQLEALWPEVETPDLPELPSTKSPFSAGVNMFHAQLYKAGSFWGDLANNNKLVEWSEKHADLNLKDAMMPPEKLDSIAEQFVFATGQVAGAVPVALGAAILAPYVGLTTALGVGIGGTLASLGATSGDYQMKKEDLVGQGNVQNDWTDATTVLALTAPDMFAVGKVAKMFKPVGDSIIEGAKETYAISRGLKSTASTAAKTGAFEGGQELAANVAAHIQTETEINEVNMEAMARAAGQELIIGSLLGVPLGGMAYYGEVAGAKQQKANVELQAKLDAEDQMTPEQIANRATFQNEAGDLNEAVFGLEPVDDKETHTATEGAMKQPGMWTLAVNALTGNATANIRARNKANPVLNAVLNRFTQPLVERRPGDFTINEKAALWEAQDLTAARPFLSASPELAQKAVDDRMTGIMADPSDLVRGSLDNLLDNILPGKAEKLSRGKIDTSSGMFVRGDYFPTYNAIDYKKMFADPTSVLARAKESLVKMEADEKTVNKTMAALKRKIEETKLYGEPLSYAANRSAKVEASIIRKMDKGELSAKQMKGMLKNFAKQRVKDNATSPLALQRELGALGQDFWKPYYRQGLTGQDIIRRHIKMANEHLAHVDTFGVDNSLFDEAVAKAVVWGNENDKPLSQRDVSQLYDLLKTSQRLPTRPINPTVRNVMMKAKAGTNMMLLGLSALVSIPEALVIALNTDGKTFLKGLIQPLKVIGDRNAMLATNDMGLGLDHAMSSTMQRLGEDPWGMGALEAGFFKLTGLPYLQHFLTNWATRSTDIYLRRSLNDLAKSDTPTTQSLFVRRKLQQAGIRIEDAMAWRATGYDQSNPYFIQSYVPAVKRLVTDTIIDPQPVDKPLWMADPRFMLLAQLKGFMTVFTNRVMFQWKQDIAQKGAAGDRELLARVAPYAAMYLAAQVGIQAVRELVKSGDLDDWDEKSMGERVWNAFGYLGANAYFVDVVNHFRWKSDPLTGLVPAYSLVANSVGDSVRALEAVNPEQALYKVLGRHLPNAPGKGWLADMILEVTGNAE